jgi:hypothetical protein
MENRLKEDETILKGNSTFKDGKFVPDKTAKRIEYLISNILKKISVSPEWTTLYYDESDGRYWEKFYPEYNWRNVGPPSLRNISEIAAKEKYKLK